jgi:hypothetical protein
MPRAAPILRAWAVYTMGPVARGPEDGDGYCDGADTALASRHRHDAGAGPHAVRRVVLARPVSGLLWLPGDHGISGDRLLLGFLGMLAHQCLAGLSGADLAAGADICFVHPPNRTGFTIARSNPATAKRFAELYDHSGVSRVGFIPARIDVVGSAVFTVYAACDVAGGPPVAEVVANRELWQLAIRAQREILTLPRNGWFGKVAAAVMGSWVTVSIHLKQDKDMRPLDVAAFNRFHHGGKVRAQDTWTCCATSPPKDSAPAGRWPPAAEPSGPGRSGVTSGGLQLPDVSMAERAQERAERRGRAHAGEQRPHAAMPGAVEVVDAVRTGEHPSHDRGDLAGRVRAFVRRQVHPGRRPRRAGRPAGPGASLERGRRTTPDSGRRTSREPPARHGVISPARCPLEGRNRSLRTPILPVQRAFLSPGPRQPEPHRWIEAQSGREVFRASVARIRIAPLNVLRD